jgi:hypothetical protein
MYCTNKSQENLLDDGRNELGSESSRNEVLLPGGSNVIDGAKERFTVLRKIMILSKFVWRTFALRFQFLVGCSHVSHNPFFTTIRSIC